MRQTSSQIDEAAAVWALRAQSGPLSPEHEAELEGWLEADLRHLGAYTRAMGVLAYFDRAAALKRGPSEAAAEVHLLMTRRRWLQAVGAAAAVGGLTAATGWAWTQFQGRISTRKGEVRQLALEDGSRVAIDTDSTVQTVFSRWRRTVRLVAGDALFDVARDLTRPFVVMAGGMRVRAVGTSFSVERLPRDEVRVLVREGRVEVWHAHALGAGQPAPLALTANMSMLATGKGVMTLTVETPESIERQLAWRTGMLDFDAVSLAEAALQLARYSDYGLEVDPDIANERVTGRFMATDPKGFAKAVAESLGLQAEFGDQSVSLHR